MLRPLHPHHSSLSKKHTCCFIPPKSCTYEQLYESSLLKRLCFSPHTTISHLYQKNASAPTPKSCTYKKKMTPLSSLLIKSVTTLNTFITHPCPKLEGASFSTSNISPLSLHTIAPITSVSFMSFLSNCKLKRVRRKNYIPHNYL